MKNFIVSEHIYYKNKTYRELQDAGLYQNLDMKAREILYRFKSEVFLIMGFFKKSILV